MQATKLKIFDRKFQIKSKFLAWDLEGLKHVICIEKTEFKQRDGSISKTYLALLENQNSYRGSEFS